MRVLVLCSHNRTRSVLATALMRQRLSTLHWVVDSAGFGPAGLPPTADTLRHAAAHHLDIVGHRSRQVTAAMVAEASLVLCAERQHVLEVVANLGGAFEHTFTLPEFAAGAGQFAPRPTGLRYVQASVPEVADPTGRSDATWRRVFTDLEGWCDAAADRMTALA